MKQNLSIKLKAGFLLTVFALNTVVAFACSVGLDLGYNKSHHKAEKQQASSNHKHDQPIEKVGHSHAETTATSHHSQTNPSKHCGTNANSHHDEEMPGNDDCCTGNAIKFQQADKSFNHSSAKLVIPALAIISIFFSVPLTNTIGNGVSNCIVYQDHSPPVPDIRIAIQSFQI